MGTVLMFHSYKGGTGKSLISMNVAAGLVNAGLKVALFDFDFLGPGLFSTFIPELNPDTVQNMKYLNDVFFKPTASIDIEEALTDVTRENDKGKLYIGLANPEPSEINSMLRLTKSQSMEAFRKILLSQEYLFDELKVDYLVIDAGPGFRFDVANAMMISDVITSVMKPSESDLAGTKRLLRSISAFVGGRTQGLVINRAVSIDANPGFPELHNLLNSRQETIIDEIVKYSGELKVPVFGTIPCLCDVSRGETHQTIITREFPDHVFAKAIDVIIDSINTEHKIRTS